MHWNVHRILKSSLSYLSSGLIGTGAMFVMSLIVSRYLGAEGIGLFSLAFAGVLLGVFVADFGTNSFIMREFAPHGRSTLVNLRFIVLLRLTSSVFVAACVFLAATGTMNHMLLLAAYGSVLIVTRSVGTALENFLKARLYHGRYLVLTMGGSIAQVMAVWMALSAGHSLVEVFLILAIIDAAKAILLLVMVRRWFGEQQTVAAQSRRNRLLPILTQCAPFAVIGLLSVLSERGDLFLLAAFRGAGEAGFFSAADRFLRIGTLVDSSLLASSLPILSSIANRAHADTITRQMLIILLLLSTSGAIILFAAAPSLIGLTFRFSESVLLLRVLSVALPAIVVGSLIRTSLFALRRERSVAWVFGIGCTFNLLLNVLFIPVFGAPGAAVISVFTEYGMVALYGITYLRHVRTLTASGDHRLQLHAGIVETLEPSA